MFSIILSIIFSIPYIQGGMICSKHPDQKIEVIRIDQQKFVDRHNFYRKKVGVPDVEWSNEIAAYAQEWADKLAQNCELKHRSKDDYGENICLTPQTYDENQVVDIWASEEKYFNHKDPVYRHKDLYRFGHYSQLIWRKTKKIGAGAANCKHGKAIWVCNYDPPGNYIDQKVY